ncbi:MAG: thiamine-phosphate kinase, partial [Bacteroidetes bacterium]|nr:thiamine-phosphate kinase [Bacteroidota bacterium]
MSEQDAHTERTEISSLGEFGLIDHLAAAFPAPQPPVHIGIGDDAAVLERNDTHFSLLATDMLLEGVHFDLAYTPLKHLGYKSVVVNLSDICAMNGEPEAITVSIGLSNRFSLEAVEELYAGIRLACTQYGVQLVGGDTTASRKGLILSISVLGKVAKEALVLRKGAKPGDIVCVSGDLGRAFIGLQLLEREKRVFLEHPDMQPDLSTHARIIEKQLKPEARMDIIAALQKAGITPTSMIDVSDGLSSELFHLSKHSGCGFTIMEERLPISEDVYHQALAFHLDASVCALQGGEDYELLFTIR